MNLDKIKFSENIKKINKVVIWGLRWKFHTHRYIHLTFYKTLKKLGAKVAWVEYSQKNQHLVEVGDLVISASPWGKMVSGDDYHLPIKKGVYYCLHDFGKFNKDELNRIEPEYLLNLGVYTKESESADQKWDEVTFLDTKKRMLYQPWGTDLLEEEFKRPVFNKNKTVFWVGSVWNDINNYGNVNEIAELKTALGRFGLKFFHVRFVPDFLNTFLIRKSRIAPAIGGRRQVDYNYLPCRMFKNISYGQLGFSNIKKFDDLYNGCSISGNSIGELVEKTLQLNEKQYIEMVLKQQEITKRHTYLQKLNNIFKAFEVLNGK
jgi:hypothetical protein